MEKVVVGLSGGVDSFVTAFLLKQQGFEVIGVNLQLWSPRRVPASPNEADELCKLINIKLYKLDGKKHFQNHVVQPFISGYLSGITPNPCAICNSFVKWELLRSLADELGVHYIATGHYTRILPFSGHHYVYKGIDPNKDQSYFLWGVREEILSRAITPLGDYTKNEVKEIARTHGFSQIADKRESMSICFIEKHDYRDFISQQPGAEHYFTPGSIVDIQGQKLGEHKGIDNYTIGQKRDIPSKDGHPQYVISINATTRQLIVGEKSLLNQTELSVSTPHLIAPDEISANDIEVKVRGLGLNPQGYARIFPQPDNRLTVQLSSPAWAVAPGQPVVFYRQDRLIGGGILTTHTQK